MKQKLDTSGQFPKNFNPQKLMEKSEFLMAVINSEGYFIFLNKAWEKTLKKSRSYLKSKPVLEHIYKDDIGKTKNLKSFFKKKNTLRFFVNRYIHKDGSLVSIEWSVYKSGPFFYCMGRDVTELQKHNYLADQLQKKGKIGWWMLNVKDKSTVWSDEVYRIHGVKSKQNFSVDQALKFYPADAKKTLTQLIKKSIKEGIPYDVELPFVSADKKNKWVHTTGHVIQNKDGKVVQMFGVFKDITHDKEKKDQLRFYFEKMMESSQLVTLGEISAGIAHEINNPLAIIQGNAERILLQLDRGKFNAENLYFSANKIIQTTTRISDIISGLKSLGRVDKEPLEEVNLRHILNEAVNMVSLRMKSQRILYIGKPISNDIFVKCRAIQLEQVVLNLLTNSMDAVHTCKKKWIKIEVQKKKSEILIHVSDSGFGVPKEIQGKIMEPFYTTKPLGKGTGLGLSISRRIIREHGGDIFFNKSKKDTTFTIQLPVLEP